MTGRTIRVRRRRNGTRAPDAVSGSDATETKTTRRENLTKREGQKVS